MDNQTLRQMSVFAQKLVHNYVRNIHVLCMSKHLPDSSEYEVQRKISAVYSIINNYVIVTSSINNSYLQSKVQLLGNINSVVVTCVKGRLAYCITCNTPMTHHY